MFRGGGENFDLNLSRELAKRGHEIEIFHLQPLFGNEKFKLPKYAKSVPVKAPWLYQWTQRLHLLPFIGNLRGLRGLPRAIGQFIFEIHALGKLWLRREEEFIVHICGLSMLGMLATKLLKKRVYVRFPGPPNLKIHYFFIKHTYGVVANGDAYETIRKTLPNGNVIKLDVGLDHQLFSRVVDKATAREATNIPLNSSCLLFVGRLVKIKNVSLLLRVLKSIQKVHANVLLVIVGDGPEVRALKKQAEILGVSQNIHFEGKASGNRLSLFFAAADIFVLPSHYDNFPNVVLEAMAMGLPVVATRVGGLPSQVIEGATGFMTNPNDPEDMTKALLKLIENPKQASNFGEYAASVVRENFDWSKTANHFVDITTFPKNKNIVRTNEK